MKVPDEYDIEEAVDALADVMVCLFLVLVSPIILVAFMCKWLRDGVKWVCGRVGV